MNFLLKSRNTIVWIILILITLSSWLAGSGMGPAIDKAGFYGAVIMVLAFIKVRLVISHFMEVRDAPLMLKLICDAWVLGSCGSVIFLYTGVFG